MLRTTPSAAVLATTGATRAGAKRSPVDAALLVGKFPSEPVFKWHGDSPPFYATRASFTLSWTDDSEKPTVLTEAERSIVDAKAIGIGLGAGLLWLEDNQYRPYPIIISTTFVPLPVPPGGVGLVPIPSTQPFPDFDSSLVGAQS